MGANGVESFEVGMMPSGWCVVKFVQDTQAKGRVVGYADSVTEIPNSITLLQVRRTFGIAGIEELIFVIG